MAKKNIADLLVDTLARAAAERVYGLAGDSLNGITDATRRHQKIRWIPVRHEETAGFCLFMLKAVLSGRGDQVIDLAKVNLFR